MKLKYLSGTAMCIALAACGGGGGGDGVLPAPPADARNGDYTVFEVNGTKQKLALNFDVKSYAMTDDAGAVSSGSFSADPAEPGTYVFSNSRITSVVNAARFRVSSDAVVGAFPFAVANSSPVSYAVQPFIAARSFVTNQAALDGDYNRFGVHRLVGGGRDSDIGSIRVANGGTTFIVCYDNIIYTMDNCPQASQLSYPVVPDDAPNSWKGFNPAIADPNLQSIGFSMARIGGQNVYLGVGSSSITGTRVMRIGLPTSAAWPTTTGYGASTEGTWGQTTINSSSFVRVRTNPDGTTGTINWPIAPVGGLPPGMRDVINAAGNPDYYVLMQGSKLSVLVGKRTNPNTEGYISFALSD